MTTGWMGVTEGSKCQRRSFRFCLRCAINAVRCWRRQFFRCDQLNARASADASMGGAAVV